MYRILAGFDANVARGSASASAPTILFRNAGRGSAAETPGSPGPGKIIHRASWRSLGKSRTSSARRSNPREYAAKSKCVGPNGTEAKSPISTNMDGMTSSESNPSNTARSRAKVASRSSHTSESTTNMSDVLSASDAVRLARLAGRRRPAPNKSAKFIAASESSRDSAGGKPNARASNTPSFRTSPSATTIQFSVKRPEDVAAWETSTWIWPVRSSR